MSISRAEFERCLPQAVGGVAYGKEGDEYRHDDGERAWRLRLTPLPEHRVALLVLPRHRVEFFFQGYSPEAQAAFLQRFALYFRRGGG